MAHGWCVFNGVSEKQGDIPEYVTLHWHRELCQCWPLFLPYLSDQNGQQTKQGAVNNADLFVSRKVTEREHYSAAVRFRTVSNRKQIFTHTLCSLLSTIIRIAKPPIRHLEKCHNNNNIQPRLTPRSRLLEYSVDSRQLASHRATTLVRAPYLNSIYFWVPPRMELIIKPERKKPLWKPWSRWEDMLQYILIKWNGML
jgi:hypothetical protein